MGSVPNEIQDGYYVWEPQGKSVAVHLNLDVIDRIVPDVMKGFGAVPKRGAEVGGLLLGVIEEGSQTIVRVEDFELIPCDYRRGPSYLFNDEDRGVFDDALAQWRPGSGSIYAVGYFRSHTRDGLALSSEDLELLDREFPLPGQIALLIKPFATKVSEASFFFREDGVFQAEAPLEFPFRRRELTGEDPPPRRSMMERLPRRRGEMQSVRETAAAVEESEYSGPSQVGPPGQAYAVTAPTKSRFRSGWVWIPLSFIFLLLGVLLGLQAALTFGQRASSATPDFSLGLSITKSGENLYVKWNGQAPAIRAASRGVLEIEESGYKPRPVQLDPAQLQNGTITYTNSSATVHFRLTVYPPGKTSITETADWNQ